MFKKTVSSVIEDISSKIGDLRDLAEKHHNQHVTAVSQAEVHGNLRDRATRIASKFEELLK